MGVILVCFEQRLLSTLSVEIFTKMAWQQDQTKQGSFQAMVFMPRGAW